MGRLASIELLPSNTLRPKCLPAQSTFTVFKQKNNFNQILNNGTHVCRCNVCNQSQASRLANERMLEERKPFFDASRSYVASGMHGGVKFLGVNESQKTIRLEGRALRVLVECLKDSGSGHFHGVSFEVRHD